MCGGLSAKASARFLYLFGLHVLHDRTIIQVFLLTFISKEHTFVKQKHLTVAVDARIIYLSMHFA